MTRTRIIFFVVVGIAVVIVVSALFLGGDQERTFGGAIPITGLVGSEKVPFFHDERVLKALRGHGLDVSVQKAGSREIATSYDITEYDFVFPAGVPAAEKIQRENGIGESYNPFFTPMVLATWRPIAELIAQQGIAENKGGYYALDMEGLIELMSAETRWKDLPGNDVFPVNKSLLVTSTDVRRSNSAAMYLALASYVANDDDIVQSLDDAEPLMPLLSGLYLRQGLRPDSSQEPFEDYLVKGMGHSPIVMIYEAQFIAQAAQEPESILDDMVLMYPEPTIFTKHILIPTTESGAKLGQLLENDPELQELAIEYGLRNSNLVHFKEFTAQQGIAMPETILEVVEPPSYEVLEGMIQIIEQQYEQGE